MKAILCKCGCKKSDHIYHTLYGANKGDCKNCSWASEFTDQDGQPNGCCPSFSAKYCGVNGCAKERVSHFYMCQEHLNVDLGIEDEIEVPIPKPRLRRRV